MNSTKETENPLIYYTIALILLGFAGYKWIGELDKTILINTSIQIGITILAVTWIFATIFFCIKGHILKCEKSKMTFKILIQLTHILIITTFIYRLTTKIFFNYSIIIHGTLTIIIFLYYNYKFHKILFNINDLLPDLKVGVSV